MKENEKKRKSADPEEFVMAIRQNSNYSPEGKAAPDNNIFHDGKSNPLSSKGN